jgi:ketosteroid isomerase-like protein
MRAAPRGGRKVADNRTTVEQFLRAMAANDIEAQERLLSDDFVEEYPQSGEHIRGKDNRRSIIENYPGGTPRETTKASEPNPIPDVIIGAGDRFAVAGQITYPNGETWHAISLIELRDGKITKITDYFGAPFEAPAWRAPYVEKEATASKSR